MIFSWDVNHFYPRYELISKTHDCFTAFEHQNNGRSNPFYLGFLSTRIVSEQLNQDIS